MIGIDIVEIDRIIDNPDRLAEYVLSEDELQIYYSKIGHQAIQFLAGRFAGKEAMVKALNDKSLIFKDVSILNNTNGQPYILNQSHLAISISHERHYAVAIVMRKENF